MKKNAVILFALFTSLCVIISCSPQVETKDKLEEGLKELHSLQDSFKDELQNAISLMSKNATVLLNSIVFNDEVTSEVISKDGIPTKNDAFFDDDALFDTLSEEEKKEIELLADGYFAKVQNVAKRITVFDNGVPEGVIETDEYIEYAGVMYSKCVPETLEIAYQIRDELYSNAGNTITKGAKLWVTPRWNLLDAPLGAIFYSYKSNFTKEEKEAIRNAMNEWEEATDGAVRFYERPLNWWGLIKWGLGITRNIRIDKVSNQNYSGQTMPGNMPWSFMHLNTNEIFTENDKRHLLGWKDSESWTHMTLIHELGHAIGLQHEFERKDRDSFVEPVSISMPGPCGVARWFQKIAMKNYGLYDYKSCMNYASPGYVYYKIKGTNRYVYFTDINTISHNDALTVKYVYSKISYKEMIDNWQDTKTLLLKGY